MRQWVRRVFRWRGDDPHARPRAWPSREAIAQLPPFSSLGLDRVVAVDTPEAARRAAQELAAESIVGFDTESRPTFKPGEKSRGPHVVQFATAHRAYVFLLHDPETRRTAIDLMTSSSLKKVGFGLNNDRVALRARLGVELQNVGEIETLFIQRRLGRGVGTKVGVALALKRRFSKSKKAGTSNWERRRLSESQLLYAANDAYAALLIYQTLT
jgi:ribonuclease D